MAGRAFLIGGPNRYPIMPERQSLPESHGQRPWFQEVMTQCDKRGRLQLRPSLRRRYGDQFWVVEAPRKVILLPVPANPVKDLREWGKPLQHLSIEEIKRIIDKRAMEEVGG